MLAMNCKKESTQADIEHPVVEKEISHSAVASKFQVKDERNCNVAKASANPVSGASTTSQSAIQTRPNQSSSDRSQAEIEAATPQEAPLNETNNNVNEKSAKNNNTSSDITISNNTIWVDPATQSVSSI